MTSVYTGNYYELEVHVGFNLIEEISILAQNYGATGIEEFQAEEQKVDEILQERSYSGGDLPLSVIEEVENVLLTESEIVKLKIFFDDQSELVEEFLDILQMNNIKIEKIELKQSEDWNEAWRKNFKEIIITDNFKIVPEWDAIEDNKLLKSQFIIYPGMGFGTGNHETTFLCLKLLFDYELEINNKKSQSVLDFGSGSGILGLSALKYFKGISHLYLYDIDDSAMLNAKQNFELNFEESTLEKVSFLLPEKRENITNHKFDIVFANILQNVLLEESIYLTSVVNNNGYLILSGLLKTQEDVIIDRYLRVNPELKLLNTVVKNDWLALVFQRK